MRTNQTAIPEVVILEPKVFGDDRGFFFESFNEKNFKELIGFAPKFVQDNHVSSKNDTLS